MPMPSNTYIPFILFYVVFSAMTLYFATAMDYSVFESGGAPDLSPMTIDTSSIIGILTSAYTALTKFVFLATISVRPEIVMLGVIYLALNIAMIFIIIDTILP
jgi:hypothetical protein